MIGEEKLDLCFGKLMVFEDSNGKLMVFEDSNWKYGKMGSGPGGAVITDWKDIPVELLLRIVNLVDDDRIMIVASGVCCGWRDAIYWGITRLNLSWCKKNMNNLVLSLAPKLSKLQILNLRQDTPQLQDDSIEMISNHCRDLQDLDLSKSFKLTDRSLYALAHGCPNLSRLNISGCSAFNDNAVAYLARFSSNLKYLNLCGCFKAATDTALKACKSETLGNFSDVNGLFSDSYEHILLQAIGFYCNKLQYINLGWCEKVGDPGVMSLANGCPDLRSLDLCGCVLITDESVVALANNCPHIRSLGLYYCQNITDRAMYSLAHSRSERKQYENPTTWESVKNKYEEGLVNLNISQCTALTPPAVQAVCDSFPALHTCPGRHSLIISGCLNLTSVHCACTFQAHRALTTALSHPTH